MRIELVLQRLEALQQQHAQEAMARPLGNTPFDYGRAVGIYAGLQLARDEVMSMIAEDREKERSR